MESNREGTLQVAFEPIHLGYFKNLTALINGQTILTDAQVNKVTETCEKLLAPFGFTPLPVAYPLLRVEKKGGKKRKKQR